MLLKNPMEDKKLNFNQPLLSARRYAPAVTSLRHAEKKTDDLNGVPPRHISALKSGPVRNPGAVPFVWEKSPGLPKQDINIIKKNNNVHQTPLPRHSPGRFPKDYSNTTTAAPSHNKRLAVGDDEKEVNISFASRKHTTQEKESCSTQHEEEEEEEESYIDALDTLSRAESFFQNCTSVSRLSGVDDLPGTKLSYGTDVKFMMDRFLPAAKAMVSEGPDKKQPTLVVVRQPPHQLKKTVDQYKPLLRYGPSFAKRYSHEYEDEEEESDDDDYDQRANLQAVCGLIPRFCLKTSLRLLNPTVPSMSMRTRVPLSYATKLQPTTSSAASESISNRTEIKSADKVQAAALDVDKTKFRNKQHGTSTHGIKTHGNGFKTFKELLADPKESNSEFPVIKKTFYMDAIHKVESPNLGSISHGIQDRGVPCSRDADHESIISERMDRVDAISSSLEHVNKLNTVYKQEKLLPVAQKFGDFSLLTSIDTSTKNGRVQLPKAFAENQDYRKDSTIIENIKVAERDTTENFERAVTLGKSLQNPAPPPLPKSPSDSWLGRTLPSMSAKNLSLCSYLGAATSPQNQCSKAPASDFKWETIVKTTKVQHRHLHYSEELLTTIPET